MFCVLFVCLAMFKIPHKRQVKTPLPKIFPISGPPPVCIWICNLRCILHLCMFRVLFVCLAMFKIPRKIQVKTPLPKKFPISGANPVCITISLSVKFSLAARVCEEKGLSDLEFWGCVRFPGRNRTAVTFIFFCCPVCSVVCSRLSRSFHLKVNIPRA